MDVWTIFDKNGFSEYLECQQKDRNALHRLNKNIKDIQRGDFSNPGYGKAKILKEDMQGYCSRRIDKKNRIVYKVSTDNGLKKILISHCIEHYNGGVSYKQEDALKELHPFQDKED